VAVQWTTAIRDRACYLALGVAYASLRTDEAAFLDASNTPAVPTSSPAGVAGERLTVVNQYSQWFNEAGATTTNDVWEHVYVREVAAQLALTFRRSDIKIHLDQLGDAWQSAMDTLTVTDPSSNTLSFTSLTPKAIRYHVMRHCLRLGTGRNRLYIPVIDIDRATQWAINHLWNRTALNFRTRAVQITIPTTSGGSAPTNDLPAGESIHSVNSRWLIFDNASADVGTATDKIVWLNETDFATRKADLGTTTGKPIYFRIEDRSGTLYWHFLPLPDAQYTVRGSVLIKAPSFATDATDTTAIAKLPDAVKPLLPDLVLAKCLRQYRPNDSQVQWNDTMTQVEQFLPTAADEGDPAREGVEPNDVYQDWRMGGYYGGQGL
jgi:hypothetical protein